MKETYIVRNISLPFTADETLAFEQARKRLQQAGLHGEDLTFAVYRRSVDARKQQDVRFVYAVSVRGFFKEKVALSDSSRKTYDIVKQENAEPTILPAPEKCVRPVVVGSGPCGLFCAYLLAIYGYRPILIERGGNVKERIEANLTLKNERVLDPETNIQFGAGGAGTFSDGKLVTRVNDPLCAYVLDLFVKFGAPEEITTMAKPHIGTDYLQTVVTQMLDAITAKGGDVHFHTKLLDIKQQDGHVVSVLTNKGELPVGALVLAVGNAARDTYRMLLSHDFAIEPKPFSVGMRIEHLQKDIDYALYGKHAEHPALAHAEYALSTNTKERGVYTFVCVPVAKLSLRQVKRVASLSTA